MQRSIAFSAFVLGCAVSFLADAQEGPNFPKADKEHQLLKRFEGHWRTESEAIMGPDQPPMKCIGTMSSRMVGEFWVVSELVGEMHGVTVTGIQTIGYDAEKKKYVGTWIDSVTSYMWKYQGVVGESGKTLVLEAEGPNYMTDGKITTFRDAYTFESNDHIIAISSMQMEDGSWMEFMKGHFRRAK